MKRIICAIMSLLLFAASFAAFADERPGWNDISEDLPEGYLDEAEQQGRVEELHYQAADGEKTALVYLPWGYDEGDAPYNILYYMHGGGGSPYLYFTPGSASAMSNMLDHMIQDGLIEPLIVVAPTFYPADGGDSGFGEVDRLTAQFPEELTERLMPAVESVYRTYAETTTDEGFRASHNHRAFGGFSMGSVTTWHVFLNDPSYFSRFMPLSGDCWVLTHNMGSADTADATAAEIAKAVEAQGFDASDFLIYALTGTSDIAYDALTSQIEAMMKQDVFRFGENIFYGLMPGGTHDHPEMRKYIYEALQVFWPGA